ILSPWKEEIKMLAQSPNIYCKVSGMVTEADWKQWKREDFFPYLDAVFELFGSERIIIGSDWPVCTVAGDYQEIMSIVLHYMQQFSEKEQAALLGGNAEKVYGLGE
ncbi:MAG: amidohydrolase, partial [Bacteroidota bacterium]|nr:amidohydrolase [Bacteroidota bacterium]